MKDKLVSFETAKLAKEKGFKEILNTYLYYNTETGSIQDGTTFSIDYRLLAPTQSLLQRWMREKHGIEINVEPCVFDTFHSYIFFVRYGERLGRIISPKTLLDYKTYEDALESALNKAQNTL